MPFAVATAFAVAAAGSTVTVEHSSGVAADPASAVASALCGVAAPFGKEEALHHAMILRWATTGLARPGMKP